jgi:HAD superfamily hydrolase (TIGR01549 family)
MPLRAVTFDFWSTLVDGTMTAERTAARVARLHAMIVGAGHACTLDEMHTAYQRALERVTLEARENLKEIGPPGRWAILAHELGIPDGVVKYEVVEQAYEDMTLDPLPEPMPYVHHAVEGMKRAGYRIGVICNTGMAGGSVLRQVLARHGLLDLFEVTVFSNEFGWAKPDPRIFEHTLAALGQAPAWEALHVGDIEDLDIEGARRAGVHSALYAPGTDGRVETRADFIVRDWRDFREQIQGFAAGLTKSSG